MDPTGIPLGWEESSLRSCVGLGGGVGLVGVGLMGVGDLRKVMVLDVSPKLEPRQVGQEGVDRGGGLAQRLAELLCDTVYGVWRGMVCCDVLFGVTRSVVTCCIVLHGLL